MMKTITTTANKTKTNRKYTVMQYIFTSTNFVLVCIDKIVDIRIFLINPIDYFYQDFAPSAVTHFFIKTDILLDFSFFRKY